MDDARKGPPRRSAWRAACLRSPWLGSCGATGPVVALRAVLLGTRREVGGGGGGWWPRWREHVLNGLLGLSTRAEAFPEECRCLGFPRTSGQRGRNAVLFFSCVKGGRGGAGCVHAWFG